MDSTKKATLSPLLEMPGLIKVTKLFISNDVCADPTEKDASINIFSIAMASYPFNFVGKDGHLDHEAPLSEMKEFNNALNDQSARDRSGNRYSFYPFANTPYPNLTSSSVLGRCFDKAVAKLGSSYSWKVLRKMGRRREWFASVEVDAIMRKEADAYAAKHAKTNLAKKKKAEGLQEARRKKKSLVRSQDSQLSDVTGASVSVPEILKNEEGPDSDLAQESEELGLPKCDSELQPEKNAVKRAVSVADNKAMPEEQKPLQTNLEPTNDYVSPSHDVKNVSLGGAGLMLAKHDTAFSRTKESNSYLAIRWVRYRCFEWL